MNAFDLLGIDTSGTSTFDQLLNKGVWDDALLDEKSFVDEWRGGRTELIDLVLNDAGVLSHLLDLAFSTDSSSDEHQLARAFIAGQVFQNSTRRVFTFISSAVGELRPVFDRLLTRDWSGDATKLAWSFNQVAGAMGARMPYSVVLMLIPHAERLFELSACYPHVLSPFSACLSKLDEVPLEEGFEVVSQRRIVVRALLDAEVPENALRRALAPQGAAVLHFLRSLLLLTASDDFLALGAALAGLSARVAAHAARAERDADAREAFLFLRDLLRWAALTRVRHGSNRFPDFWFPYATLAPLLGAPEEEPMGRLPSRHSSHSSPLLNLSSSSLSEPPGLAAAAAAVPRVDKVAGQAPDRSLSDKDSDKASDKASIDLFDAIRGRGDGAIGPLPPRAIGGELPAVRSRSPSPPGSWGAAADWDPLLAALVVGDGPLRGPPVARAPLPAPVEPPAPEIPALDAGESTGLPSLNDGDSAVETAATAADDLLTRQRFVREVDRALAQRMRRPVAEFLAMARPGDAENLIGLLQLLVGVVGDLHELQELPRQFFADAAFMDALFDWMAMYPTCSVLHCEVMRFLVECAEKIGVAATPPEPADFELLLEKIEQTLAARGKRLEYFPHIVKVVLALRGILGEDNAAVAEIYREHVAEVHEQWKVERWIDLKRYPTLRKKMIQLNED